MGAQITDEVVDLQENRGVEGNYVVDVRMHLAEDLVDQLGEVMHIVQQALLQLSPVSLNDHLHIDLLEQIEEGDQILQLHVEVVEQVLHVYLESLHLFIRATHFIEFAQLVFVGNGLQELPFVVPFALYSVELLNHPGNASIFHEFLFLSLFLCFLLHLLLRLSQHNSCLRLIQVEQVVVFVQFHVKT